MKAIVRRFLGIFAVYVLATACAYAQTTDVKVLAETLKQGGYVVVFRHTATNPNQADTNPINYDDITKQRLLSDAGKEMARQIGESFKILRIPIGKVYTSKLNRAVETGRLIGATEVIPTVDITDSSRMAETGEHERQPEALKKMVATLPEAGKNTLIVTHKPNIVAAFGKDWSDVKEGEATIFHPDGSGKAPLVARVQADDWVRASK